EKFGYTHAEIAQVIGKSRTSVTEILSLNQMPEEVRDLCRQADISTKSLLLQVVRQPDLGEMKRLVERISSDGLTRQDIREEKGQAKRKGKAFTYRFKGKNYTLIIKFNKANVSNKEVGEILKETLDNLK